MRDERVLTVLENRVLGGKKRDDAIGDKIEQQNGELRNFYTL